MTSKRTVTSSRVLVVPSGAIGGSTPNWLIAKGMLPVIWKRPLLSARPVAEKFIVRVVPAMLKRPDASMANSPLFTDSTRALESEKLMLGAAASASRSFPFMIELSQSRLATGMVTFTPLIAVSRSLPSSAAMLPLSRPASHDQSWIVDVPSTQTRLPLAKVN